MTSEREPEGTASPQVMLTVAAVARRLGVAPSTLRTWDRRYGLGPSAHSAGSHRRYSPADLNRLVVMRGLVLEGVPPVEAAQIALTTAANVLTAPPARSVPTARDGADTSAITEGHRREAVTDAAEPVDGSFGRGAVAGVPALPPSIGGPPSVAFDALTHGLVGHVVGHGAAGPGLDPGLDEAISAALYDVVGPSGAAFAPLTPAQPGGGHAFWPTYVTRAGGGRVLSLPDASPRARGLARAAMALDAPEITRLLREAIAGHGVIEAWDELVLPVLQGLGERWRVTGEGIDVEHAFSEAVLGVLRGICARLYRPRNIRPVLLSCPNGDHHTLPLHVLAAALAEVEVGVRMLGVGLPASSLVSAARRIGPAAVFVYARMPVMDLSVLHDLPRQRPAPRLLIGGSGWHELEVPSSVVRVESLRGAVELLRESVHV